MTGALEHNFRLLAEQGAMLSVFPTRGGMFQANVAEPAHSGWTTVSMIDPVAAINEAMRQRLTQLGGRDIVKGAEFPMPDVKPVASPHGSRQIDIEEAIAAAVVRQDDEDLIG